MLTASTVRTGPCAVSRVARHSIIRCNSAKASPEKAFKDRLQEVKNACPELYPRLATDTRKVSCSEFRSRYEHLEPNQTIEADTVVLHGRSRSTSFWLSPSHVLRLVGRIRSYRIAGSKLLFFDIIQNGQKVQVMCNQRTLTDATTPEKFKEFYRLLRRGDAFCMYTVH